MKIQELFNKLKDRIDTIPYQYHNLRKWEKYDMYIIQKQDGRWKVYKTNFGTGMGKRVLDEFIGFIDKGFLDTELHKRDIDQRKSIVGVFKL